MTQPEVQYEKLRPAAIREAREACPVAYLPLGTLEWHGLHAPVGLDSIKIHRLCVRCAQQGGGLVFPPLHYGESREEGMMDANPSEVDGISDLMGLPPENFKEGYMRKSPSEAFSDYQRLLLHLLNQSQSLGFKVIVLAAGHYPLIDHARAAASLFHQQRRVGGEYRKPYAIPWVFSDFEVVQDLYPGAGDHAGFWETSLLLDLAPDLVDLDALPSDDSRVPGVLTDRPVREANAEFGAEVNARIVERVIEKVTERLDNPDRFRGHGLRF